MAYEHWLVYVAAVIVLALTPGPNSLLALTHGGLYGVRRAWITALGSVTAFGVLIGLSTLGLSAVLAASSHAFEVIKWIGAGYLVYLGIRLWRTPAAALGNAGGRSDHQVSYRRLFSTGFLVAIANPKVILFYGAFLPQFMNPVAPLLPQFVVLAITFMVAEWLVEVAIAAGAHRVTPWLNQSVNGRLFNRATGGVFIVAGGALATVNR